MRKNNNRCFQAQPNDLCSLGTGLLVLSSVMQLIWSIYLLYDYAYTSSHFSLNCWNAEILNVSGFHIIWLAIMILRFICILLRISLCSDLHDLEDILPQDINPVPPFDQPQNNDQIIQARPQNPNPISIISIPSVRLPPAQSNLEKRGLSAEELKELSEHIKISQEPTLTTVITVYRDGTGLETAKVDSDINSSSQSCTICLDIIKSGEYITKLPGCHHSFHQICITNWLQRLNSCPLCRSAVVARQ